MFVFHHALQLSLLTFCAAYYFCGCGGAERKQGPSCRRATKARAAVAEGVMNKKSSMSLNASEPGVFLFNPCSGCTFACCPLLKLSQELWLPVKAGRSQLEIMVPLVGECTGYHAFFLQLASSQLFSCTTKKELSDYRRARLKTQNIAMQGLPVMERRAMSLNIDRRRQACKISQVGHVGP